MKYSQMSDEEKRRNRIATIIFVIGMMIFLLVAKRLEKKQKQEILATKEFAKAKIFRFSTNRFGQNLTYEFYYKNKKYISSSTTNLSSLMCKKVLNTYWSVILSKEDPNLHYILMNKNDFKDFNLQKPDTLMNIE